MYKWHLVSEQLRAGDETHLKPLQATKLEIILGYLPPTECRHARKENKALEIVRRFDVAPRPSGGSDDQTITPVKSLTWRWLSMLNVRDIGPFEGSEDWEWR